MIFVTAAHNSVVGFVQLLNGSAPVARLVRHTGLPFESLAFLGDSTVVATGWDANPHIYAATGGAAHAPTWTLVDTLDKKPKPVVARAATASGISGARAMFDRAASQGIAIKGNVGSSGAPEKLDTRHQNAITYARSPPVGFGDGV